MYFKIKKKKRVQIIESEAYLGWEGPERSLSSNPPSHVLLYVFQLVFFPSKKRNQKPKMPELKKCSSPGIVMCLNEGDYRLGRFVEFSIAWYVYFSDCVGHFTASLR